MKNISANPQLYSYAYLATAFDSNVDIFNNYVTLIEYYLADKHYTGAIGFDYLLMDINEYYDLNMPRATLKAILSRMQQQGKIKNTARGFLPQFEKFDINMQNLIDGIDNEVSSLFVDIKEFLGGKGFDVSIQDVRDIICSFIYFNSVEMMNLYVNKNYNFVGEIKYLDEIIDYIEDAFEHKGDKCETLLKLNMGAMRVSLLDLQPDKLKEFNEEVLFSTVILDTNFLLRLLDLQSDIDCKTAKETFNILKKQGTRIVVREETISELIKAVNKYLNSHYINSATKSMIKRNNWRVSGFLAAEGRGKSRSELFKYTDADYIIKQLEKYGIEINSDKVAVIEERDIESLMIDKNRESYTRENAKHDLTLINYCKLLRKGVSKSIGNEKIWILTNDVKLAKWHKYKCCNHGFACITETQLNCYIWMKTGNEKLNYNAALIALADRQSLGVDELLSFQNVFMQHYDQSDESNLNNLIMVFASGSIGASDILDIHDNESLHSFVAKRIDDVSREIASTIGASEKVVELTNELSEVKTQLENEKENSVNSIQKVKRLWQKRAQYDEEIQSSISNNQKLKEKKQQYNNTIKRLKNTGRLTVAIILLLMLGVYFALMNNLSCGVQDDKVKFVLDYVVPAFGSLLLSVLFFLITGIIFGQPKNPKETFKLFCIRVNKKYMLKHIGSTFDIEGCNNKIHEIETEIADNEEMIKQLKEKIRKLDCDMLLNEA